MDPKHPIIYNDRWFRVMMITAFSGLEFYITYSGNPYEFQALAYLGGCLIKAICLWELVRFLVFKLDVYIPWPRYIFKRLFAQLSIPLLITLLAVAIEYRLFPDAEAHTLITPGVLLIAVLLFSECLIYAALYFYSQYATQVLKIKTTEKAGISLKLNDRETNVTFAEIVVFYSEGRQTWVITKELKKFPSELSLDRLEAIVPGNFFRINREYLIVREAIRSLKPDTYGKVKAETDPNLNLDDVLIVSREKARSLKQWFGGNTTVA